MCMGRLGLGVRRFAFGEKAPSLALAALPAAQGLGESSPRTLPGEALRLARPSHTSIRRDGSPARHTDKACCFSRWEPGRDGRTSTPADEVRTPWERTGHKCLVSLLLFTWKQKTHEGGITSPSHKSRSRSLPDRPAPPTGFPQWEWDTQTTHSRGAHPRWLVKG